MRTLRADEIETRVARVFEWGVSVLLYKTSRTDMDILDETFGEENWVCDYKEIKGNLFCGIGVRCGDEWVWKWDCGIESREDGGNEKKGEASDAMKRAGFKWGIGRELYTAPRITIRFGKDDKSKSHYYTVKEIEYDSQRRISHLVITENDMTVFTWDRLKTTLSEAYERKEGEVNASKEEDLLRKEIYSLGGGDLTRINDYIGKIFSGKILGDLNEGELRFIKLNLARAVNA